MLAARGLWPTALAVLGFLRWQEAQDYRLHPALEDAVWKVARFVFERLPVLEAPLKLPETTERSLVTLSRLHELYIPTLTKLSVNDIIQVHQSDEAFARLRSAVRSGVAAVELIDADSDNWQATAQHYMSEATFLERRTLQKELGRSNALSKATTAMRSVAIAGIGAGVGVSAGGNWKSGLASAGAASVAEAVRSYVAGLRDRRVSKALLNHLLVLSPEL